MVVFHIRTGKAALTLLAPGLTCQKELSLTRFSLSESDQ